MSNDVHIVTDSTSDFQGVSDYTSSAAQEDDEDSILYSEEGSLMDHFEPGPPGIARAMKSQVADSFEVSGSWHERSHTYYHYENTVEDESCDNQVQDM